MFFPTSPSPPRGMIFNFPCLVILVCFFLAYLIIFIYPPMAVKVTFMLYKKKPGGMKTPAGLFVPHMQLLVLDTFPRVLQNYQKGSESQFPTQLSIAGERRFVKAWNVNILLISFLCTGVATRFGMKHSYPNAVLLLPR